MLGVFELDALPPCVSVPLITELVAVRAVRRHHFSCPLLLRRATRQRQQQNQRGVSWNFHAVSVEPLVRTGVEFLCRLKVPRCMRRRTPRFDAAGVMFASKQTYRKASFTLAALIVALLGRGASA